MKHFGETAFGHVADVPVDGLQPFDAGGDFRDDGGAGCGGRGHRGVARD